MKKLFFALTVVAMAASSAMAMDVSFGSSGFTNIINAISDILF